MAVNYMESADPNKKIVFIREQQGERTVFLNDTEGSRIFEVNKSTLQELESITVGDMDAIQSKIAEIMLDSREIGQDQALDFTIYTQKIERLEKKLQYLNETSKDHRLTDREKEILGRQTLETQKQIEQAKKQRNLI